MVSKAPGSDLCVPLHVEGVHLLKDEGDGVLADNADVRLESDDLLIGHIEARPQLAVLLHQLFSGLQQERAVSAVCGQLTHSGHGSHPTLSC